MTKSREVIDFWKQFCCTDPKVPSDEAFQTWCFGNSQEMSEELANLVIAGKKIATASLAVVNELQPETAPIDGGYSVVTDLSGRPRCVIRTEEIRHLPFDEVDEQFAFDEGEGDRTLAYWRRVHHDYFSREANKLGVDFNPRSTVCCERFRLLYHP